MRWILTGCSWLALITLTVSLQVSQRPRFCGLKTNSSLSIYCLSSKPSLQTTAQWYKVDEYKDDEYKADEHKWKERRISKSDRRGFRNNDMIQDAVLELLNVEVGDSGVYFCVINGTRGPGTELQAVRRINFKQALYRSKMKDGLIVLQGLLLAACVAATLLRKRRLMARKDSIYEEPETDHIYEGLAIETCGGDLYEDLSVYAQAEGTEAPWE